MAFGITAEIVGAWRETHVVEGVDDSGGASYKNEEFIVFMVLKRNVTVRCVIDEKERKTLREQLSSKLRYNK